MITKEMIENRLVQLQGGLDAKRKRLADLRAEIAQCESDINATSGAFQDCEHWLSVLEPKTGDQDV